MTAMKMGMDLKAIGDYGMQIVQRMNQQWGWMDVMDIEGLALSSIHLVTRSIDSFVQADAVEYKVPEQVDRFFFFNPFSLDLLKKVLARILESYYAQMRNIQLFFYYPSDEYIAYLMTVDELMFADEIDCRDLFPGDNPRERIVVFEFE